MGADHGPVGIGHARGRTGRRRRARGGGSVRRVAREPVAVTPVGSLVVIAAIAAIAALVWVVVGRPARDFDRRVRAAETAFASARDWSIEGPSLRHWGRITIRGEHRGRTFVSHRHPPVDETPELPSEVEVACAVPPGAPFLWRRPSRLRRGHVRTEHDDRWQAVGFIRIAGASGASVLRAEVGGQLGATRLVGVLDELTALADVIESSPVSDARGRAP
jgi:hypothetical protein